jgi:hypothetical protein
VDLREEQDTLLCDAGDLERIIGAVSTYWDPSAVGSVGGTPGESTHVGFFERSADPAPVKPREVRMITTSDSIFPRTLPEVPVPSVLPLMTDSPLALLTAASGGSLDLKWLETFDNATLESVVPRDPHSGRPLTIGSLEHTEGKCKPCIFYLRAKCFKGLRCSFCHFNHMAERLNGPTPQLENFDLHSLLFPTSANDNATAVNDSASTKKSKRLRPSKRTREMIKQINEQKIFSDIIDDPNGPPLSILQTTTE